MGRTIATFGFLEEVLGKAIFVLESTRDFPSEEEAAKEFEKWAPKLPELLTGTLKPLADRYFRAAKYNPKFSTLNADELVDGIKKASDIRNVLCHGSWRTPDETGRARVLYVDKKLRRFDTPVDVEWLRETQKHVSELAANVISTITHMGYQFPGGKGPGKSIF